jgi:hypothetical protein
MTSILLFAAYDFGLDQNPQRREDLRSSSAIYIAFGVENTNPIDFPLFGQISPLSGYGFPCQVFQPSEHFHCLIGPFQPIVFLKSENCPEQTGE